MLDRMKSRTPGGVTRRGVLVGFAAAATVGLAREIAFEEGYDAVRALEADELWEIQWYPETPIGSYVVRASSLTACIEAILTI